MDIDLAIEQALDWGDLFLSKAPPWTDEQDQFLRDHIGWLTDQQIGEALGRTAIAIKLRRQRDLRLPCASKMPGYLTGNGVAAALGVDIHTVTKLIDRGILPGRILPGERNIRVVRRITLLRWAVNPMNWPYFQAWRRDIPDAHIRRLITRQLQRWDDEWLTPQQAADLHGVEHTDVNRYIRAGKLWGIQWGNWWLLRSVVCAPGVIFYKGKGTAQKAFSGWGDRADTFIIRARTQKMKVKDIAARMKQPQKSVEYRVKVLNAPRGGGQCQALTTT